MHMCRGSERQREQYVRRRVLEFIGISGSFLGESERFVSMFLLCDVVFIEKKRECVQYFRLLSII